MSQTSNGEDGLRERIGVAIRARGLNITQFSALTGIPYRTIHNYLRGERTPNADSVAVICARLGISANWLLMEHGPMDLAPDPFQPPDLSSLARDGELTWERMVAPAEGEIPPSARRRAEIAATGAAAHRLLDAEILPACDAGRGRLVVATARTAPGEARRLGRDLREMVQERWREATEAPGEGETLLLVLGLAVEGEDPRVGG